MAATPRFFEVQTMTQSKLGSLLVAFFVLGTLGCLIAGILFIAGNVDCETEKDEEDCGLLSAITLLAVALIFFLITWLLFALKLSITVEDSGCLEVTYYPLKSEIKFRPDEIESAEAVDYAPIREFGGWGLRANRSAECFNMHGTRGVLIQFRECGEDGKRRKNLLLGSQKADELAAALQAAKD
eukprot:TRINITY_DN9299_c0_g1_i1.p1 TRINITY_DN9299_c0_g1~~TRINITY_DN9299_c0_g1_i1.p1  ORF type:complete len:184 (-),score=5.19 TRINITY_DN9299_c0_g1_i1:219-770(-)